MLKCKSEAKWSRNITLLGLASRSIVFYHFSRIRKGCSCLCKCELLSVVLINTFQHELEESGPNYLPGLLAVFG